MPPKCAVESKDVPECILRIGKYNNVVAWNLEMRSVVGTLYGSTANFLTDNVRYVPPYPREEDYMPINPDLADGQAPPVIPAALITKLREDCFTGRRKDIALQRKDEQKIWSIMWTRMSPVPMVESKPAVKVYHFWKVRPLEHTSRFSMFSTIVVISISAAKSATISLLCSR